MPTNLFCNRSSSSKSIKLTILSLLLPLVFYAQSLTGLWVGSLDNDSTTVRKDQSFEIALTEYNGKVYGYSRSEFIVDDVLYYIVKRVKGTIEGDVCEVTDDEIVAYNFPKKLDKNIKVTSTFRKEKGDSVWHMDGKWKTNATKKYYSVTGKVELEAEKDLTASKIFPHLEELKLAEDVAFYKERKEGQPIVRIAKPEKAQSELSNTTAKLSADKDVTVGSSVAVVPTKEPGANPIKPTLTTANGKTASVDETVAVNTKKNNKPDPIIFTKQNEPTNSETKNIAADKKIEDLIAKNNLSDNNKQQPGANEATEQKTVTAHSQDIVSEKINADKTMTPVTSATPNITNEIKTESVVKNNTVVEKKDPITQDIAGFQNQQPTTVKQTETTSTNPDKKTETKTTASNTNPTTTNNITSVKNNTTVEKKEPVKQDVAAIKTQQMTTVKKTETFSTTQDNRPVTNGATSNNKPDNKAVTSTTASTTKPIAINTEAVAKNNPVTEQKAIIPIAPEKRPDADITLKAAMIAGRKSEFSQVVNFKADSLQISLYDNGEIDGDTVSVFMNGEVLLSKQGLKSSAIKKTIYLTPGLNDEFTLVMFAESLGKYPPNTGLLVIRDGDDVYNLRFSSDFQKNAGIVFKKKK